MLELVCVSDINSFSKIQSEWNKFILDHFPEAYYLDHDWLFKWWTCYAHDDEVYIYCAYDEKGLVGLIPLTVQKDNYGGFPVRRLGFLGRGFGREDFPVISSQREVIIMVFDDLEKKVKWDLANFTRLHPESSEKLKEVVASLSMQIEKTDINNPVIEINGTYEDYFSLRSKNFKANYRKKNKRINEWGKPVFKHEDNSDLAKIIEKIESIAMESWQVKKGVHMTVDDKGHKFLKLLIKNFSQRGILDVSFLYLDDKPIAYLSGARFNKTYYAIETGYKDKYFDVSPGMLLHLYVLERLYEYDSIELMDLGYDAPYKRKWTDNNRPEKQVVIFNKNFYPQIIRLFRKTKLYSKLLELKDKIK